MNIGHINEQSEIRMVDGVNIRFTNDYVYIQCVLLAEMKKMIII